MINDGKTVKRIYWRIKNNYDDNIKIHKYERTINFKIPATVHPVIISSELNFKKYLLIICPIMKIILMLKEEQEILINLHIHLNVYHLHDLFHSITKLLFFVFKFLILEIKLKKDSVT